MADLELRGTLDVVRALNDANAVVFDAPREAEGAIAALVDAAAIAGASCTWRRVGRGDGRRGAAEWGPTFSFEGVVALVAGAALPAGPEREAAEDDADAGAAELRALAPTRDDVVVAVSASGSTPYAAGDCAPRRTPAH